MIGQGLPDGKPCFHFMDTLGKNKFRMVDEKVSYMIQLMVSKKMQDK